MMLLRAGVATASVTRASASPLLRIPARLCSSGGGGNTPAALAAAAEAAAERRQNATQFASGVRSWGLRKLPQRDFSGAKVPERGIVRSSLGIYLQDPTDLEDNEAALAAITVRPFSPFVFETGEDMVFKGMEEAVLTLGVAERAFFHIPPNMAYGDDGAVGVPPNTALYLDMEVHHATDLSMKARLNRRNAHKEKYFVKKVKDSDV